MLMYRENQYQAEKQYFRLREKLMDSELKAHVLADLLPMVAAFI